jgi:transposase
MKTNIRSIRKSRQYSSEFKKEIVSIFESGKFSVEQLKRLYGINKQSIYDWIYKYSSLNQKGYRVMEKKESATHKLKLLEQKIKDLEQTVGQKQMTIDYLERLIDLAKSDLHIDIKKNYNTAHSNGSVKTKKR